MLRNRPYYDDAPDLMETGELTLAEGLSDAEYEEAMWMASLSRGVMIVTGSPRSGKDLFGNVFAWKMKRYFNKQILRDEAPRRLFGDYIPFDRNTINEDIQEMEEIILERSTNKVKIQRMSMLADDWLEHKGNKILRNNVLYLTEFGGYMDRRRPMNPMNIFLSRILRRWGHLDLLVIGTTQLKSELDIHRCTPFVTHEARCKWSMLRENTGNYAIVRVKTITPTGAVEIGGKPIQYRIDGGLPREVLGGKRYFDLYNSKSAPVSIPAVRRVA